jgi:methionyl aminopeptidase
MIVFKTEQDIEKMRNSADLLGRTHGEVAKFLKPGITTKELDKVAHDFILDNGAKPSFLNYKGFPATLCISVNDVVVHGFPSDYVLKEGDIASIDCGVYLNGFHADSAYSYGIGKISESVQKLLRVTKESLYLAIDEVKPYARIGDIGFAVQSYVQKNGFSVVRELTGHGVGKNLHEEPDVPNYGRKGNGVMLRNGMTLAIEPMVNMGKKEIFQERDGWTIRTKDRLPSAHFEHTVALHNNQALVLTTFKYIEEEISKANGAFC